MPIMSNAFFHYAVLRYYHDPVTQEFLNVDKMLAKLLHFDETSVSRTGLDDMDIDAFGAYYQHIFNQPLSK